MSKQPALSSIRRMTVDERNGLITKLMPQLHSRFPRLRFETLTPCREKATFSNLELIIGVTPESKECEVVRTALIDHICTGENVGSRSRLSLQHGVFQIDVYFVEPANVDTMVDFMSYQELGALMAKWVHAQGLSISERGLFYRLRRGEIMVADIELANSWSHALDILGYSHARWSEGFANLDEVFAFVSSSPLFLAECYPPKADAKPGASLTLRHAFGAWLKTADIPAPVEHPLQWLFNRVPGFEIRYQAIKAADKKSAS